MIQLIIDAVSLIFSFAPLLYLVLFLLGTIFGSFFKVVVDRSEVSYTSKSDVDYSHQKGSSWLKGRSHCKNCQQQICWYDNIPLFSYLILKGRCRYCQKPIGLSYPLTEFLTGVVFIFVGYITLYSAHVLALPFPSILLFNLFSVSILWLILLFDWQYMIIPDELVILIGIAGIFRIFFQFEQMRIATLKYDLLVAFIFFITFLLLRYLPVFFLKKYGMGLGDIKLIFPLVLLLGFRVSIVGVFCAFIIGGVWGIILITTAKAKIGQMVSFGPLLVLGSLIAMGWGEQLWNLYW